MRDSLRYKKGRYDQIILEVLREAPLSRDEILDLYKDPKSPLSKIPYSTLDQRLKQLEKYGLIEHIPDVYKIAEKLEEANREEVNYCLIRIQDENENEDVIYENLRKLRIISSRRRIATILKVLQSLEESLVNPKITGNCKNFEEYMGILKNVLQLEYQHHFPETENIIQEITGEMLLKIIEILKGKPDYPNREALNFLAISKKKIAIETLFELAIRFKNELGKDTSKLEYLGTVLAIMHPENLIFIDKKIDDLIRNPDLNRVGRKLKGILSWKRYSEKRSTERPFPLV